MIFGVTIAIVLGHHELCQDSKLCVLTAPPTSHSPISVSFLRPPYSLRHNNIEIRPINNLTMASKCSSESKTRFALTLNLKLEMIKLLEEGMSKAKIGQN